MPAFQSSFNSTDIPQICGLALVPLKTKFKGPAPIEKDASKEDFIDEVLDLFRANVLFKNFEVNGAGDRLMVYVTLYITQCLNKIGNNNKDLAGKALYQLAIEKFTIPGDSGFALGGMVQAPSSNGEADQVRLYLQQLRQEVGVRLVERVYAQDASKPSKWWLAFSKRKFLNKELK